MRKALDELLWLELTLQYEWVLSQPATAPIVWCAWEGFRV